jgi:hypothetical protein
MGPIPRHYGACAVAPGIIKKEHATWLYASNPTMAAAPDCSLHTAGREGGKEGWREDPRKSPAGGSQVFFALKYTLRFLLIDFDSSSSSSSSSTHHHHHPHHRHNSDNP